MKVLHRKDMPGVREVQFPNGDRYYGRGFWYPVKALVSQKRRLWRKR